MRPRAADRACRQPGLVAERSRASPDRTGCGALLAAASGRASPGARRRGCTHRDSQHTYTRSRSSSWRLAAARLTALSGTLSARAPRTPATTHEAPSHPHRQAGGEHDACADRYASTQTYTHTHAHARTHTQVTHTAVENDPVPPSHHAQHPLRDIRALGLKSNAIRDPSATRLVIVVLSVARMIIANVIGGHSSS